MKFAKIIFIFSLFFAFCVANETQIKDDAKSQTTKTAQSDRKTAAKAGTPTKISNESEAKADSKKKSEAKTSEKPDYFDIPKEEINLFLDSEMAGDFNLSQTLNTINESLEKSPLKLHADTINPAKIIICVIILFAFWLLRLILPPLLLRLARKLFHKLSSKTMSESQVSAVFTKQNILPFTLILYFGGFSLCLAVIYYPQSVNLWLSNTFAIIYALLWSWLFMTLLNSFGVVFASKLAQKSGKKQVANLIIKIAQIIIVLTLVLVILAHLGVNISAIIASLGIGGVAIALATKDIIANFFASLLIAFDESLNQGDLVEIADVEGIIVETGLRKTAIRTFDNALVYIPNSNVMAANVKNWAKRKLGRSLKITLGVSYDASAAQLENCINDLREYLAKSELVAHGEDSALNLGDYSAKYRQNFVSLNDLEGYKNACTVTLLGFGDSSINIECDFYTKTIITAEFKQARQVLLLDFMKIIEKNGLTFAFPSLSVYMEKTGLEAGLSKDGFAASGKGVGKA